MRTGLLLVFVFLFSAGHASAADALSCSFDGTRYFHRWAGKHLYEFTPDGQEDLALWVDMISVVLHPLATDGDALANIANSTLENYKKAGGIIVRTHSKPRTPNEPAEHFVAVIFPRPDLIEIAFARFKLVEATGCVIVRSHREYGEKAGDRVGAWLQENGPKIETHLLAWDAFPRPKALLELPESPAPALPGP